MKKFNFFSLILAVIVISNLLISDLTFSQIDPNATNTYEPALLTPLIPRVFPDAPYGVDAIISVGPFDNYTASTSNGFCETDICVNPANPLNFVCTDNRIITGANFVYCTTNGGISWSQPTVPTNAGDPTFSADSLGNFYLGALNNSVTGFVIYKSVNGGASWSTVGNINVGHSIDKEWIACDQTNGPFKNNVYMAYVDGVGFTCDVQRSTNNGATWTYSGSLGSGTPNPGPDIAVDKNGKVFVAWYGGSGTQMRTSTDGGVTFTAAVVASNHTQPGTVQFGRNCLKNAIRVNGMPHIAIDMSNGPFKNYVYCMYVTNPPGPDNADVFCTRSTDGGVTWNSGSPVRVNNDATFTDQFMADVSVDAQGRVWAMWYDSRNDDPANVLTETYGAYSTDGGLTWNNFKIGNQNFNPNTIRISQGTNQAYYIGDYQNMSGKTFTFPCYSGQNNNYQDYVAYLPDYGMSFPVTADHVPPGGTSVNYVEIPMMGNYSGTVTYSASVSPSPSPGSITLNFLPSNVKTLTGTPDSIGLNAVTTANVPANTYTVTVTGAENGGPRTHTRSYTIQVGSFTGLHNNNGEIPKVYSLYQNYPNPFNPSTQIEYALPKQSLVSIKIFDILGREVSNLVNEVKPAGSYQVTFNASNLPSGIYYYKINAGEFSDVKKMILIK